MPRASTIDSTIILTLLYYCPCTLYYTDTLVLLSVNTLVLLYANILVLTLLYCCLDLERQKQNWRHKRVVVDTSRLVTDRRR